MDALRKILNGYMLYKNFNKALLSFSNIADKIGLENIIRNSTNSDIKDFVTNLIFNNLEEIEVAGQKFVVSNQEAYSNEKLIGFLSAAPDWNNLLKAVFS